MRIGIFCSKPEQKRNVVETWLRTSCIHWHRLNHYQQNGSDATRKSSYRLCTTFFYNLYSHVCAVPVLVFVRFSLFFLGTLSHRTDLIFRDNCQFDTRHWFDSGSFNSNDCLLFCSSIASVTQPYLASDHRYNRCVRFFFLSPVRSSPADASNEMCAQDTDSGIAEDHWRQFYEIYELSRWCPLIAYTYMIRVCGEGSDTMHCSLYLFSSTAKQWQRMCLANSIGLIAAAPCDPRKVRKLFTPDARHIRTTHNGRYVLYRFFEVLNSRKIKSELSVRVCGQCWCHQTDRVCSRAHYPIKSIVIERQYRKKSVFLSLYLSACTYVSFVWLEWW